MKNLRKIAAKTVIASLLVTMVSCDEGNVFGIEGEGPVVSQTIEVSSFSGIDISISANVVYTQGDIQEVRVEGQQNIINNLETDVDSDVWDIEFDKNTRNYKDLTIYITTPEVHTLDISGSGKIETLSLIETDNLRMNISGSGKVICSANTNTLTSSISGSGSVSISGSGQSQDIHISGAGAYNATSFVTATAEVKISGSGNCKVQVNEKLDTDISGSGSVYYSGNPQVNSKISGSGRVSSLN